MWAGGASTNHYNRRKSDVRKWRNVGLVICWMKQGIPVRRIVAKTGLTSNQVYYYWYRHVNNGGEKGRSVTKR